jgi:hypothetical protein
MPVARRATTENWANPICEAPNAQATNHRSAAGAGSRRSSCGPNAAHSNRGIQPTYQMQADGRSEGVARINDQERPEVLGSWNSSKYDAINNRCYIRVYKHIRRTQTPQPFEHEVQQVYDAQVDDLLASASIRNGKKDGSILDQSFKGERYFKDGEASYEAAIKYMDELMADPRK